MLLDRATSLAVTVPRVPGGFWPVHGFLGGGGRVIFVVENANNSEAGVYECSGTGAPTLLDTPNSRDSLWVAGDYAIWSNGLSLFRRDLVTGETVTVSTNATNGGNEVDAAGDVVFTAETAYQSGNHQIYWYANGATVQLTNDATLWNVAPRFDGSNVVYLKETPCCSNRSTYAIWLYTGGSEVQLAQPSARLVWPAQDYQITAGYAAYVAPDSAGTLQVMLRDPSGSTNQVSDVGGAQSGAYPPHLVAVGADGSVAYSIGNNLFLGRAGNPSALLSDAGCWTSDRASSGSWGNFATYLDGTWLFAINGTLYALEPGTAPTRPGDVPLDINPCQIAPTAAEVAGFRAVSAHGRVSLSWASNDETRILAYVISRRARGSRWEQLTRRPLAARHPGQPVGSRYRWLDTPRGRTGIRYRLQAIRPDGSRALLGTTSIGPVGLAQRKGATTGQHNPPKQAEAQS